MDVVQGGKLYNSRTKTGSFTQWHFLFVEYCLQLYNGRIKKPTRSGRLKKFLLLQIAKCSKKKATCFESFLQGLAILHYQLMSGFLFVLAQRFKTQIAVALRAEQFQFGS